MSLTLYQVDAFADRLFAGNPAAVCPLDYWLADETLQAIAAENNLSETAFFVATDNGFHLRWFTPSHEVELCGHATLASAWVLFNLLGYEQQTITFHSLSGSLLARRTGDMIELDFPLQPLEMIEPPPAILDAFSAKPIACFRSMDYMVVFADADDVLSAEPDMSCLKKLDRRGVIITATGSDHDFINRFFAPRYRIDEDPVTGSAYTQLVPYWAKQLGKTSLVGKQVSKRGGVVHCRMEGERVFIAGTAVKYMQGSIEIDV